MFFKKTKTKPISDLPKPKYKLFDKLYRVRKIKDLPIEIGYINGIEYSDIFGFRYDIGSDIGITSIDKYRYFTEAEIDFEFGFTKNEAILKYNNNLILKFKNKIKKN